VKNLLFSLCFLAIGCDEGVKHKFYAGQSIIIKAGNTKGIIADVDKYSYSYSVRYSDKLGKIHYLSYVREQEMESASAAKDN
jgi:hypothetical protein